MDEYKLYMLLLGCRVKGRYTEQHDIFFGIGQHLKDLIPGIQAAWPEAKGEIHIDAWREVTCVDGCAIAVDILMDLERPAVKPKENNLFFINLGGYKENEFEEFHYKMLVVADSLDAAKNKARKTAFFKHNSVANSVNNRSAAAHIDDKYGVDVDDIYAVKDILSAHFKEKFTIRISAKASCAADAYHLGYQKLKDYK